MDRFPDRIDSKFRYVLVASNRAEQLMNGARPKVDPRGLKLTRVAMEEVRQDLVAWSLESEREPEEIEVPAAPEAPEEGEPS